MSRESFMRREAMEGPEAVARFLAHNRSALQQLGNRLRSLDPPVIITSARGSSDHAAGYLKYAAEIVLGVPCASVGASVASVYRAPLRLTNALAVTISQSGKSPDIVALQDAAKAAGALTVALVNDEQSPVARGADLCLPLMAGFEESVAATKSFITALAACAGIVAAWRDDKDLWRAVEGLPEHLRQACALQWPAFEQQARGAESLYVLGRGPSYPIAAETALKLKETSAIHAEAYSAAEVMHGPLELVGEGFPVLVYAQNDAARPGIDDAVRRLMAAGADVCVAGGDLPVAAAGHPLLAPVTMIQTAYLAMERIAQSRGRDPDRPRQLRKVTETV